MAPVAEAFVINIKKSIDGKISYCLLRKIDNNVMHFLQLLQTNYEIVYTAAALTIFQIAWSYDTIRFIEIF
jgi:hypothetical protein